jgi:hypothetical protein
MIFPPGNGIDAMNLHPLFMIGGAGEIDRR